MPSMTARYYNAYYPGHIALPPNTSYIVHCGDLETMVHLVRHVRPVVITDFRNSLVSKSEGEKTLFGLHMGIPTFPEDQLALTFRTPTGDVAPGLIVTKDHDFVHYGTHEFTELTVGAEVRSDTSQSAGPGIFYEAVKRLVALYRVVTRDVTVQLPGSLRRRVPVIRSAEVRYSEGASSGENLHERLVNHLPVRFRPEIISYKEFLEGAQESSLPPREAAIRVGHHLAVGTRVSAGQLALIDAFEGTRLRDDFRFTVVEAVSVAEVVAFEFVSKRRVADEALDRGLKRKERKGALSFRVLVNSFLPTLLKKAVAAFPTVIGDLDKARKNRDRILHSGASASREEALAALNAAQTLLFAIESCGERAISE